MAAPTSAALLPTRRATIALASMLSILIIGWRIPLPGLDLDQLAQWQLSGDAASRFSIFALGAIPLFAILAFAEIAKLVVPPLTRWQVRSVSNARRYGLTVAVLSLLLAAWQGYGVLEVFWTGEVARHDAVGFALTGLGTYVASAVLMVWLADHFGVHGLDGFWLLMAAMTLASFPDQISTLIGAREARTVSDGMLLAYGLAIVAGIALVVFANLLLIRNGVAEGIASTSMLLWPPYLAGVVASYALMFLPADSPGWPFLAPTFVEVADLVLTVVFTPVFVFAYVRRFRLLNPGGSRLFSTPTLLVVTGIQIALCVGSWFLPMYWDLPVIISGAELLVLGTAMLRLLDPAQP